MPRRRLAAALSALALLAPTAAAAAPETERITKWGSFVFARTGEHTTATDALAQSWLTPLGAKQALAAGAYLRGAYLVGSGISGINGSFVPAEQVAVLASDEAQFGPAAAAALLQGAFPPARRGDVHANPLGVMAQGGPVQAPLGGYQYPWIQTAGPSDPNMISVNGAQFCPLWDALGAEYEEVQMSSNKAHGLYSAVGKQLGNAEFSTNQYGFWNAWNVFQQVSYLYSHDAGARRKLDSGPLSDENAYNRLRYYADQYLRDLYGGTSTDIRTIAGRTLAAKIIDTLASNVVSRGAVSKLTILVGELTPLVSLFSILKLDSASANFTGMPQWGSLAMFEVYSKDGPGSPVTKDAASFPSVEDLFVRFVFRNGSADSQVQSYNILGLPEVEIPWRVFEERMTALALVDVSGWCSVCDAWITSPFCLAYNSTAIAAVGGDIPQIVLPPTPSPKMSSAVAGVIGACATIVVLGVLFALGVAVGVLRLNFARGARKDGGGGFKGDQKMASDADLTAFRGPPAVTVEGSEEREAQTKERIGSWELKQAHGGGAGGLAPEQSGRPASVVSSLRRSFDTQDPSRNPFQDPVKPDERV